MAMVATVVMRLAVGFVMAVVTITPPPTRTIAPLSVVVLGPVDPVACPVLSPIQDAPLPLIQSTVPFKATLHSRDFLLVLTQHPRLTPG